MSLQNVLNFVFVKIDKLILLLGNKDIQHLKQHLRTLIEQKQAQHKWYTQKYLHINPNKSTHKEKFFKLIESSSSTIEILNKIHKYDFLS